MTVRFSGASVTGWGRAQAQAQARGIAPVLLGRDHDLETLARQAITHGADVIGMAGGDGSMSVVATVAARHGIPSFASRPARGTTSRSTWE